MASAVVLTVGGVLDSTTYRPLRDAVIKAALDEPSAVLVEVSQLRAPSSSAWSVFTSARWHVSQWPDVPIALVCVHPKTRDTIRRNGITRYVPVYPTVSSAIHGLPAIAHQYRRRARAELPAHTASPAYARDLTALWLIAWGKSEFMPIVSVVVSVLVENVLSHTDGAMWLRLECNRDTVTVAVEDTSTQPAGRHERTGASGDAPSLTIIPALCRAWGNHPMPNGKTVWAVVGPENLYR